MADIIELKERADAGSAPAARGLGYEHQRGHKDNRDDKKAFKWYKKAFELGDVGIAEEVAVMYYYGFGTKQDFKESLEWYIKATNQINRNLVIKKVYEKIGDMYRQGIGTKQDFKKALKWYIKSENWEAMRVTAELVRLELENIF